MARRILIVDDNPDLALTLKLAVELDGHTAHTAATGREALKLLKQEPADILITDLFMPDSDGFELIDAVRRELPGIRIIVMSGGTRRLKGEYLSSAALMDVDATLQKPFDIPDLLALLKTY